MIGMEADVEVKNSTHRVEIVPIVLRKHPGADSLSIADVFGYTCVVRTEDWKGIELGAYLPPDSMVDVNRAEFSFLADCARQGFARIRARKIRGIVSFGLLIPAPSGAVLGDDVAEQLGVKHYEFIANLPVLSEKKRFSIDRGQQAEAPGLFFVNYDVDALRRYYRLLFSGEPIFATEKIDGSSSRFVYFDGKMYVGSRREWKREYPRVDHITLQDLVSRGLDEENAQRVMDKIHARPKLRSMWWELLDKTVGLEKFCRDNPGTIVYGEAFGPVGRIKYGELRFAAFDLLENGNWVNAREARERLESAQIPCVPLLADGWPYDFERVCAIAEGPSCVIGVPHDTIREGVVVKPLIERRDEHIGRVCFKAVSAVYLEKY